MGDIRAITFHFDRPSTKGKMLSALRTNALRAVINGQGKVLAVVPSRDYGVPAYLKDVPELTPGVAEGYSPMGHKILTRDEKMKTWNYVNSVYFGAERDMKNFPNPSMPDSTPPVRFGWMPASWFDFFYSKTGVTGPYCLLGGMSLWMLSKEYMVVDHYFWEIPSFWGAIFFLNCHPSVGPKLKAWLTKEFDRTKFLEYGQPLGRLRASAEKDVTNLKRLIEECETQNFIKQAKEEGVGLQLEAAYRARLQHAFTEVKKRLDYEAEKTNLKRRFEQDHMVNWIVSSVTKSITPQQEKESIKSCLAALKQLSQTNKVSAA